MIPRTFLHTRVTLLAVLGLFLVISLSSCAAYYDYVCWYFGSKGACLYQYKDPRTLLLGQVPPSPENPQSREKEELGKMLFFDPRLSKNLSISCESCHATAHAFSDPRQFSRGQYDQKGDRNAPSVLNAGHHDPQFWDGRAKDLEDQALRPIQDKKEMADSLRAVVEKLADVEEYKKRFADVFQVTIKEKGMSDQEIEKASLSIARAIAAFERTLDSNNSAFDKWIKDEGDLSKQARRGWVVAKNNKCLVCHTPPRYTDTLFHNIGVTDTSEGKAGRSKVTNNPLHFGQFKTPTLRSVELTAPYMHSGQFRTLEEVVDFYSKGGGPVSSPGIKDPQIEPLDLSDTDQSYLVEFLKSLTGQALSIIPPTLPEWSPAGAAQKGQ